MRPNTQQRPAHETPSNDQHMINTLIYSHILSSKGPSEYSDLLYSSKTVQKINGHHSKPKQEQQPPHQLTHTHTQHPLGGLLPSAMHPRQTGQLPFCPAQHEMSEGETTLMARSLLLSPGCNYHLLLDRDPGCFLILHQWKSYRQHKAALLQHIHKKLLKTPLPFKGQQEPKEPSNILPSEQLMLDIKLSSLRNVTMIMELPPHDTLHRFSSEHTYARVFSVARTPAHAPAEHVHIQTSQLLCAVSAPGCRLKAELNHS